MTTTRKPRPSRSKAAIAARQAQAETVFISPDPDQLAEHFHDDEPTTGFDLDNPVEVTGDNLDQSISESELAQEQTEDREDFQAIDDEFFGPQDTEPTVYVPPATVEVTDEFVDTDEEKVLTDEECAALDAQIDKQAPFGTWEAQVAAHQKIHGPGSLPDPVIGKRAAAREARAARKAAREAAKAEKTPKEPVLTPCECGCETMVPRRFAVGHASKHRAALKAQAKADAPPAEPKFCECGCGAEVQRRFVRGHDSKLHSAKLKAERVDAPPKFCECGCGTQVTRRFARGHASQYRATGLARLKADNAVLAARIVELQAQVEELQLINA